MKPETTEEWGIVCDDDLTLLFDTEEEARKELARVLEKPAVYPGATLVLRWVTKWYEQ